MQIGDLNKRITIQAPTKVADNMGGSTVTWIDVATIWGAIWPISANEQVKNMQQGMTISHRIRMRFRRDLKAAWKLKYNGRYFNIVSIINPNESNQLLDVLVKEAA